MKRRSIIVLVASTALLAFFALGCSQSSDDPPAKEQPPSADQPVPLADAKVAYAVLGTIEGYANPSSWPKPWGETSTPISSIEYGFSAPGGSFIWHLLMDREEYPQNRTYTLTMSNFSAGSGYTVSGTIIMACLFPTGSGGPSQASIAIDTTLSGGAVKKVTGSVSTTDMTTFSGSLTFDGTIYTAAQLATP